MGEWKGQGLGTDAARFVPPRGITCRAERTGPRLAHCTVSANLQMRHASKRSAAAVTPPTHTHLPPHTHAPPPPHPPMQTNTPTHPPICEAGAEEHRLPLAAARGRRVRCREGGRPQRAGAGAAARRQRRCGRRALCVRLAQTRAYRHHRHQPGGCRAGKCGTARGLSACAAPAPRLPSHSCAPPHHHQHPPPPPSPIPHPQRETL
jgi:hypothetical protein